MARITGPEFQAALDEARERDRELAVLTDILGRERSLDWAQSLGVVKVPELAALVAPLPPVELRRITAAEWPEMFLWSGLVDARAFADIYARYRGLEDPETVPRVLDFGCGCGRIARFMRLWRCRLTGCDLNPALVEWCAEHLSEFDVTTCDRLPPTPYEDGSFEMVYACSVFTHTPEHATEDWLSELYRILAPGGLLVFTTTGMRMISVLTRRTEVRERWGISEERLETLREEVRQGGVATVPFRSAPGEVDPGLDDGYGLTFLGLHRIARVWAGERFEVVEQHAGGSRGMQDLTVLRRR